MRNSTPLSARLLDSVSWMKNSFQNRSARSNGGTEHSPLEENLEGVLYCTCHRWRGVSFGKCRHIVLGLLLLCTSSFMSCEEEVPPVYDEEIINASSANHLLNNALITLYDTSRVKATIQAEWTRVFDNIKETHFENDVVVEFFSSETGERVSRLTSDSLIIQDKTRDMTARGNVKVFADSSQTTMTTQLLLWNDSRQKLVSPVYVKVVSPTETVEGIGFESDKNLENYVFYKVKAIQQSSQFTTRSTNNEKTSLLHSGELEDEYDEE